MLSKYKVDEIKTRLINKHDHIIIEKAIHAIRSDGGKEKLIIKNDSLNRRVKKRY